MIAYVKYEYMLDVLWILLILLLNTLYLSSLISVIPTFLVFLCRCVFIIIETVFETIYFFF